MVKLFSDEIGSYWMVLFLFLFLLITYNQTLGILYSIMVIFSYFVYVDAKFYSYPTVSNALSWLMRMIFAGVAYLAFIYFTPFLMSLLGYTEYTTPMSIIKLTAAATPIFSESLILTIAAFAFLIPITETRAWARLMEFLSSKLNVKLEFNPLSIKIWGITFLCGMIAVWFHIQAKGVTNTPALIAVFVFFTYSMWLVLAFKETMVAVLVHVFSNLMAVLTLKGLLSVSDTGLGIGPALQSAVTLPYLIGAVVIGYIVIKKKWVTL